jgi:hypothetical protein
MTMPLDTTMLQRLSDNDITLISLNLGGNQIDDGDVKELSKRLANNTALTSLYLGHNNITNAGAKDLAQALAKNTTLIALHLEYNLIGDEGAKAFAQALMKNYTLSIIDLQLNAISDIGARALVKALARNPTPISLNLGTNQISDSLYEQIKNILAHKTCQLKNLKRTALEELKLGRPLLYHTESAGNAADSALLPLEIREKIISRLDADVLMTEEQQRLLLNYAEGKTSDKGELLVPLEMDKSGFFKMTKCDRVMKPLKGRPQDEVLAGKARLSVSWP